MNLSQSVNIFICFLRNIQVKPHFKAHHQSHQELLNSHNLAKGKTRASFLRTMPLKLTVMFLDMMMWVGCRECTCAVYAQRCVSSLALPTGTFVLCSACKPWCSDTIGGYGACKYMRVQVHMVYGIAGGTHVAASACSAT